MHPRTWIGSAAIAVTSAACASDETEPTPYNPYRDYRSETYSDPALWLCHPDASPDYCAADLDATEILPDNSFRPVAHEPLDGAGADCFYVYPTVDINGPVGNHTDFSDVRPMLDPLLSQGAPFTRACRVIAPLYRQVTLPTFSSPEAETYLEIAYNDVQDAFRHYMGRLDRGGPIVLIGHSQGAQMLRRLVQREFDGVPRLRQRLAAALLIGGDVLVEPGRTDGGSFHDIPLCTRPEEPGCVIAYRSFAEGYPPAGGRFNDLLEEGRDFACTNPADLSGDRAVFSATYLPTSANQAVFSVGIDFAELGLDGEPFVLYRDFYTGRCAKDRENHSYLEIGLVRNGEDQRTNRIPFDHPLFTPAFLGMHVLDFNFAMGDLVELVRQKIRAVESGGGGSVIDFR